jgi:hypothetical protein
VASTIEPERRAAILRAKLLALLDGLDSPDGPDRRDGRDAPRTPFAFAGGAAVADDRRTWVLIEAEGVGLGATVSWALRQGLPTGGALHVVVDGPAAPQAASIARQAARFAEPPVVHRVEGRTLAEVAPAAPPPAAEPSPAARALGTELLSAGLELVVEHGVVTGEVLGLEVARVVEDPAGGGARVEVGVGRNDREAFAMLNGDLPTADALAKVSDAVHRHRRAGAPPHPLNRLAGERWLRAHLLADPNRLAGWQLEAVPGVAARTSVHDRQPAFAVGRDDEDRPVVLACSVGIDLDLVPVAAELRGEHDPGARLVLAVPARDAHPVTAQLAGLLAVPAELLPIEGDWR